MKLIKNLLCFVCDLMPIYFDTHHIYFDEDEKILLGQRFVDGDEYLCLPIETICLVKYHTLSKVIVALNHVFVYDTISTETWNG
jgi:hypothetical protein